METKSIIQMARGSIEERIDLEMTRILDNILDPNTKPTLKRKLTVTVEITPQIQGQTDIFGGEQEAPAQLKLVVNK